MKRTDALRHIWRITHDDYKGYHFGKKGIMLNASEGGGICPLDDLTDEQIKSRVPEYKGT